MANTYWGRSRFSLVDTAWLHMGMTPTQTPIGGLILLEDPVTLEQLKTLVSARLLRFPRFRQRAREPYLWFLRPAWEDDPQFNIDAHVHAVALPSPADWTQLRAVFEDLMGVPLHPGNPLWQMHLVEHYGQGSALILRLEHAMADGDAMMHVLDVISDLDPSRPWTEPAPAPPRSVFLGTVEALFDLGDMALSLPGEIFHRVRSPRQLTREGIRVARAFGKVVFCLPDPQTILRGERSTAHRLAVSEPIPLAEVKAIGKPLGATVNDVILSAVAGGLRRYMRNRGQGVDDFNIRGIVPVSLRTRAEAADLGNGFGLVFLSLPVDIGDPEERLHELKGRMDEIKQSPEAQVSYAILHLFGVLPRSTQNLGVRFFTTKVTVTMTNVAGPGETRYLAGSRIERILFSVPHPGDIAIGMSIMSYDGTVLVTLDTDAQLIPHPEDIIDGFQADLEVLRRRAVEVRQQTAEAARDGQQPAPAKV